MQQKLLIANWKANPVTLSDAQALFRAEVQAARKHPNVQTVICPPFIFLEELAGEGGNLGAQDTFWAESGAFTGEISTVMLKAIGITHVLVGHSERRALGETDEMVNKKLKALLKEGMTPILLIGEPEQGSARSDYLIDQLTRGLEGISAEDAQKILFCYEPVWAISTSRVAQPAQPRDVREAIQEMKMILDRRYTLHDARYTFLYGGSVDEKNIADFLSIEDIQGGVVGGASLRPEEFAKMIEIAAAL